MNEIVKEKKDEYQTWVCCLFCKFYNPKTRNCSKDHTVVDEKKQACKEWRYVA